MPPITALVHTRNDATRLGRALETLRSCDQILVVDHASSDDSARIAHEYGAIVKPAAMGEPVNRLATCPWILCVLPTESVSEGLESSLYEWKLYSDSDVAGITACSLFVREETQDGWGEPTPETRLIRRDSPEWEGPLPLALRSTTVLQGELLRFRSP